MFPAIFIAIFNLINILLWIPITLLGLPVIFLLWLMNKTVEVFVTSVLKRSYRPPNKIADVLMVCMLKVNYGFLEINYYFSCYPYLK